MHPIYEDYLQRLETLHGHVEKALAGLPTAALDWTPGPGMNSLAVLVAHLAGSERYWIGDVAGGEPSGRDREAEFKVHGLDPAELQARLAASLAHSRSVLQRLSPEDLTREVASSMDNASYRLAWALDHALEHVGLHTGHIQIERQMLDQHPEAWQAPSGR